MGEGDIETQTGARPRPVPRPDAFDVTAAGEPAASPAREAARQFGRYVVLERLGAGGMGEVFAAWDPELERRVALKRLAIGEGSEGRRARLLREAQAMARLRHPHVVGVHDVGRLHGEVFIAMEYVDGKNLREWVERDVPSWPQIIEAYAQAARGLAAAHTEGLVHRDFKPDNAMIDGGGRVQVLDFGLAAAARPVDDDLATPSGDVTDSSAPVERLTVTGAVVGTPAYMAPEQFGAAPTDPRTDQFSFAVALFEALYGRRPFAGETWAELAANVLDGKIVEPDAKGDVPRSILVALRRALQREPEARFPSMDAVIHALLRATAPRSRRWVGFAGLALVTAGIGTMVWATPTEVDPCADAGAPVDPVWSDARRAELAAVFAADHRPFAADAWDRAQRAVDDHAGELRDAYTEACRATHVEHTQSAAVLDRRRVCLDRQVRDLDALLSVFARGDDTIVANANDALDAQTTVDQCDAAAIELGAGAVATSDPERVDAVRRKLAEAGALRLSAVKDTDLVDAALEEARALGDPVVLAEATVEASLAAFDARELDRAAALSAESHLLAVRHGIPDILLTGLSSRISVAIERDELEIADQWSDMALAHARWLDRRDVAASIRAKQGLIASSRGRYDDAIALYDEALTQFEHQNRSTSTAARNARGNLGTAYLHAGRVDDARRELRATLDLTIEQHGADSPLVAQPLQNLAQCDTFTGDFDEAEVLIRRALQIRKRAYGDDEALVGELVATLGALELYRGRPAEGEPLLREALRILEATRGAEDLKVSLALNNLAGSLIQQRRYEAALPFMERAHAIKLASLPSEHPDLLLSYVNLAELRFELGRARSARADLEVVRDAVTQEDAGHQRRRRERVRALLAWIAVLEGQHDVARATVDELLDDDETGDARDILLGVRAIASAPDDPARDAWFREALDASDDGESWLTRELEARR